MKDRKLIICVIVMAIVALIGLLWLQLDGSGLGLGLAVGLMEGFEDDQCLSCAVYFGDVLNMDLDFVSEDMSTDAQKTAVQQKISDLVGEQGAILVKVLDAVLAFLDDKTREICKVKPTEVNTAYFNCMNQYILNAVSCKAGDGRSNPGYCKNVGKIIDEIMKRAVICAGSGGGDCDDIVKYPKIEERNVCKATSQCKTIADLEKNIRKFEAETRKKVQECMKNLQDSAHPCSKYYVKTIMAKVDAVMRLNSLNNEIGKASKLGSMGYGKDDSAFDAATMVLANLT